MKLVLLSGGSGKRLWPLSNDTRSKQFLKVLENENGEKQSMVQRVWEQLKSLNLAEDTIIATSKMQRDMIQNQIGTEVPLIIEPERRDTFPAIALATSYLHSIETVDSEELVVVLPVDAYVEKDFFNKIKELEGVLKESNADLALLGVKPSYPSEKYGYIVPDNNKIHDYFTVNSFKEKPDENNAKDLISSGALWNTGIFAFKLSYLIDTLKEKGFSTEFDELYSKYTSLPKISFDYEIVETAKHIVALAYNGSWKDLGTWNTLTEEMATGQIGKGFIRDSLYTHLINELDIPVTVLGVKEVVVAASPDGILVTDKASSPKIKDIISDLNQLPMYEERTWGWSRVLDYAKYENEEEMVTKRICILEGKNSSYHYHNLRDEVWTIVKGEGELALDDHITRVKAGDIIHLPSGKKHGIKALIDLEFIEVQTGASISDEDFKRIFFDWDEVVGQFKKSNSKIVS